MQSVNFGECRNFGTGIESPKAVAARSISTFRGLSVEGSRSKEVVKENNLVTTFDPNH